MKKYLLSFISVLLLCTVLLPALALATGEIVRPNTDSYGDGLLIYTSKNKMGYTDVFGNVVIKAAYASAGTFHNGMACVQVSGGGGYAKSQFVDRNGKVVFSAPRKTQTRYYSLCDYWDVDYATVEIWSVNKKNGSIFPIGYNYVDQNGKLFNDAEYQYAGAFQEGYALVGTGYSLKKPTRSGISDRNEHWLAVFSGNESTQVATEYWYIDKQGQKLGSLTWAMGRNFHDGMAAVAVKAGNSLYWGFINSSGTLQVAPEYAKVGDYVNGMIWVSDGENYGYINEKGDVVVPLIWKSATPFDEDGYAVVMDDYHAKIIDKQGNVVLDSEYSSLSRIEGTDRYRANDGIANGMIDRSGTILVPLAYERTSSTKDVFSGTRYSNILIITNEFGDLITPVIVNGSLISEEEAAAYPDGTACKKVSFPSDPDQSHPDMCVFTDEKGKTLSINMIDNMRGESFSLLRSNGRTILFDMNGNRLGSNEWDGFASWGSNENVACVRKGDFYGFIDIHTGETVLTPQFTGVTSQSDGILTAKLGENAVYLDAHARPLLPEITKGSGKDAIKALQQHLIDMGYLTGKANGSFSKQLTEAIARAQEALGLEPTGLADSDFQYALQEMNR